MKLPIILCAALCMAISAPAADVEKVRNLLDAPPYVDTGMGRNLLVDQPHLFMMQVALKPGQAVPQHNANSHVHIIVLDGTVIVNLAGKDSPAKKGDLVPIAYTTPMSIRNDSKANATFLIVKAPNPSQMGK